MSLVPALCLGCSRVLLVSLSQAQNRELACPSCGADARIAPSCSYPEADRAQFEELSEVVAEANMTRTEAASYADTIRHALWSGSYTRELERLCVRMPSLLPVQLAAGKNSGAQRRVLVKLQTILQALSSAARGSAEQSRSDC
jgi:hypothetical protein